MNMAQLSHQQLLEAHQQLLEMNQQQAERIEHLEQVLRLMLKKQHGPKAEQSPPGQGQLFPDDSLEEASEASADEIVETKPRKRGKRKKLDETLERKTVHYELPEDERQCACGACLNDIGTATSEHYETIPARVVVVEHVEHKYACPECGSGVVQAKKPAAILPKTNAGPHLLAQLATSKFVDGVPLHRQEAQLNRLGIELQRNTMARWLIQLSEPIMPLINLMDDAIRAGPYIQCDETPFQTLKEPGRKAQTKSYMWVRTGGTKDRLAVLYDYAPSRGSAVVETLFEGYKGLVQCDGYSAYRCLEEKGITLLGCMAHARRKFNDAQKACGPKENAQKTKAAQAIGFIKRLYKVESDYREVSEQARVDARQTKSKPILNEFKAWLDRQAKTTLPKSPLGKAVQYTLNQWERLIRYCDYSFVEIDNNRDERAIRPFAIGRNNWLFAASEKGAHTNAHFYSLIETCKLHGHEPYAYLCHIFKELPSAASVEDFEALLPWNLSVDTLKEIARTL